jgi:hypothetical protein
MIGKLLRGYVEGLGSKTIAFVVMAIVAALVAPILFSKFGIDPELTREVLYGLGAATLTVVLKQFVVDVKSNGATTTQYLLTKRALQELEAALPDGTKLDAVVKEVLLAMNRAQVTGGIAGAPQGAPQAPPAA